MIEARKNAGKPRSRHRRGLVTHLRSIVRNIWPVFNAGDWYAARYLEREPGGRGRYRSTGDDPQLRLGMWARAGWYMFEAQMRLPGTVTLLRLYPNIGHGETEDTCMTLRIRTGQLAKRIIYLPRRAWLRLDPMSAEGSFEVQHLRLVRVGERFARNRMRKKLVSRHPMFARGIRELPDPSRADVMEEWTDYCNLFDLHSELMSYQAWINSVEQLRLPSLAEQGTEIAAWKARPLFSIVTPTYNTDPDMLRACLESVLAQTYPYWEMCIADDASSQPHVRSILEEYSRRDPRIRVKYRAENGNIVDASNTALELAKGDFVVLLDHDDLLARQALYSVARAIQSRPTAKLIYSDEDKLDQSGKRCDPYFKPDFSEDLLYSQNYFSHLGVYRRDLVAAAGGFRRGFEGSQDYDLVLRCLALVDDHRDILHISEILYHWRMSSGSTAAGHNQKSYASEAGRAALQDYFDRAGHDVRVSERAPGIYRHHWPLPQVTPLVSLIVPTRDGHELLKKSVGSILERTDYANFEVLIVDNQSQCPQTLAYLEALATNPKVRVLRYDAPFNYSAINNFAARHARGSVLGLINNDVEVITPEWLGELVSHVVRPGVGCVGAKLYYPNDTIQHAGVVCGVGGIANHAHRYFPKEAPGYFGRLWVVHNVSAVTGAVLLLRKQVFEEVGGLDEQGLPVAFNDVDLCLKAVAAGYRNIWTPYAELYHYESISRGSDDSPEKRGRFEGECQVMRDRWGAMLANDPFYNPNLTRRREDFSLSNGMEADYG